MFISLLLLVLLIVSQFGQVFILFIIDTTALVSVIATDTIA